MGSAGVRPVLKFARLTDKAFAPTKGSAFAAGYDLYAAYDTVVPARGKALVKTDIQVAVPSGCYGRVAPRSGLAVKNFIDVGAGVVDEDYRGNLGVVLFNFSEQDFTVTRGDRVAQFICQKIEYPELEECQNLDETERGAAGFGSTGVSMNAENNTAEPRKSSEQNEKLMDLDSPVSPKKRKALSEVDAN